MERIEKIEVYRAPDWFNWIVRVNGSCYELNGDNSPNGVNMYAGEWETSDSTRRKPWKTVIEEAGLKPLDEIPSPVLAGVLKFLQLTDPTEIVNPSCTRLVTRALRIVGECKGEPTQLASRFRAWAMDALSVLEPITSDGGTFLLTGPVLHDTIEALPTAWVNQSGELQCPHCGSTVEMLTDWVPRNFNIDYKGDDETPTAWENGVCWDDCTGCFCACENCGTESSVPEGYHYDHI
jgi:hypothetical protein